MKSAVYEKHERLKACPPAQLVYIIARRLVEHGLRATGLWIQDKIMRRMKGYSPPALSKVAPHLYVGGQHTSGGLEAMRAHGIRAVVNMREESDDADHGRAPEHYLWLPITDDRAPSLRDLEKGAAFIQKHTAQGHGVYVHCAAGVGRAPTMAAAYLVHQGATPEEAWAILKEGRPFIRPTPPQLDIIRAYAKSRQAPIGRSTSDRPNPAPRIAAAPGNDPERSGNDGTLERRVQWAYERIAADAGLTGALTDEQAKALLSWAESEVRRLAQSTLAMDETRARETLGAQLPVLRRHLRAVARQSARAEDPMDAIQSNLSVPRYPEPDAP